MRYNLKNFIILIINMKNVFYINLDEREKRKQTCEKQLQQLGWKFDRFSAIKHKNGAIGCAMSHLKILENAKKNKLNYVIIFEDDFIILDIEKFKKLFKDFLKQKVSFDVLKLGANAYPPYKEIHDNYVKLNYSQTTHAYMVFDHYYDTLIKSYKEAIYLLNNYGKGPKGIFCCDSWQNTLIHKYNHTWLLLYPLCVTQKTDYSDIEKKKVSYSWYFLNLKNTENFRKFATNKLNLLLDNYDKFKHELENI